MKAMLIKDCAFKGLGHGCDSLCLKRLRFDDLLNRRIFQQILCMNLITSKTLSCCFQTQKIKQNNKLSDGFE